ncbi:MULTISPECIES: response regulator [Spirulina sp. CCY15215]|uniref:sensor histidine kinase n=1 Tax=Spirulina sp. CCY15215 TaxID=2767591 RepID=UPI001951899D|nr:response regulator [Spirulina major]
MKKILIADDHSTTRLLLKRLLQQGGYDIVEATDGAEAIAVAKQVTPALIICDWMMPEFDGLQVCQHLKQNPQLAATFFILLSAKGEIRDRVQGLDAGADDFLTKPVDKTELLARVRSGLRLYEAQQQLSLSNQKLSQTLKDLQKAQIQLIQAEKMSSLGQLVAGVAHEINNPVTFIRGNLSHAQSYANELLELANLASHSQDSQLIEAAEDIDLDFMKTDFPLVLDSMHNGAKRIQEIVDSLRNFSRLDEAQQKSVNIHEGIDSTLSILQSKLNQIEIIKNYGDLPNITCYPGQINQVFLHLFNNAIDAIKEGDRHPGQIKISTNKITGSDAIAIKISDNGAGIKPENLPKLFEPFFTTKAIGSGKGLGLSTSYSIIVEQHEGELECVSTLGEGSEFAIVLPIGVAPT